MTEVLPTFLQDSFLFADVEVPDHVDETPEMPNYVGFFAVFGSTEGNKPYTLAVDVATQDTALLLAEARKRQQESDITIYGYSDDVYIVYPDGSIERTYFGRWKEDD